MYSELTIHRLNAIAHHYRDEVFREVHSVLEQIRNTGAGAQSLTVEVVEGNANASPQLMIMFDDHLIFLDKSKMQWTKLPDMKEMVEWAKTKQPDEKKAIQLAWAVGWDKVKNDTWKPKRWRKKSLSKVLKEMNERIVKAYDEVIEEEFVEAARVL